MSRARSALGAFVIALSVGAIGFLALQQGADPVTPTRPTAVDRDPPTSPAISAATAPVAAAAAETYQGYLYGRIATVDGATFQGRLRWGTGEEAFWSDYFNGTKNENPWIAHVPAERLPRERRPFEIFGIEIAARESPSDVSRPFMAQFGDLQRIEARGDDVRVTLKSGTVFDLDRLDASDLDDGVRVWDAARGVVDLDSLRIRAIELLPTPPLDDVPNRLHGKVSTHLGEFTGFIQWPQEQRLGTDELAGRTAEGPLSVRFDTIRSIARRPPRSLLVTLLDGREITLSDHREADRGIYLEERRYGRVRISWTIFERVDFSVGEPRIRSDSGPGYGDFPPGQPLTGRATTRSGRQLSGRLVYDLDESATTDTLDGQFQGLDFAVPFARIASVEPFEPPVRGARVVLLDGEVLQLDRSADVDSRNGGVLVFADDGDRPEYLRWEELQRLAFDRSSALVPPRP